VADGLSVEGREAIRPVKNVRALIKREAEADQLCSL
jgi:hypothetical protein